nr:hypothetical protein [Cytobacillus firmus]
MQLILDPKLSDEDRFLNETDFYEGLDHLWKMEPRSEYQ